MDSSGVDPLVSSHPLVQLSALAIAHLPSDELTEHLSLLVERASELTSGNITFASVEDQYEAFDCIDDQVRLIEAELQKRNATAQSIDQVEPASKPISAQQQAQSANQDVRDDEELPAHNQVTADGKSSLESPFDATQSQIAQSQVDAASAAAQLAKRTTNAQLSATLREQNQARLAAQQAENARIEAARAEATSRAQARAATTDEEIQKAAADAAAQMIRAASQRYADQQQDLPDSTIAIEDQGRTLKDETTPAPALSRRPHTASSHRAAPASAATAAALSTTERLGLNTIARLEQWLERTTKEQREKQNERRQTTEMHQVQDQDQSQTPSQSQSTSAAVRSRSRGRPAAESSQSRPRGRSASVGRARPATASASARTADATRANALLSPTSAGGPIKRRAPITPLYCAEFDPTLPASDYSAHIPTLEHMFSVTWNHQADESNLTPALLIHTILECETYRFLHCTPMTSQHSDDHDTRDSMDTFIAHQQYLQRFAHLHSPPGRLRRDWQTRFGEMLADKLELVHRIRHTRLQLEEQNKSKLIRQQQQIEVGGVMQPLGASLLDPIEAVLRLECASDTSQLVFCVTREKEEVYDVLRRALLARDANNNPIAVQHNTCQPIQWQQCALQHVAHGLNDAQLPAFARTNDATQSHLLPFSIERQFPFVTLIPLHFNLLWTWRNPAIEFTRLLAWQRVNHFPNSRHLTRKDLFAKCVQRYTQLKGFKWREQFRVQTETFILPQDHQLFVQTFLVRQEQLQQQQQQQQQQNSAVDSMSNTWIVKPTNSSRGRGISVLNDLTQILQQQQQQSSATCASLLVQRYITHPLLLSGHKFDLRLYCLVTSVQPLEAFLYRRGFARLSTKRYELSAESLHDKFVHITNSSVQKVNLSAFRAIHGPASPLSPPPASSSTDAETLDDSSDDGDTKISLDELSRQLQSEHRIDFWTLLWPRITSLVTRTLLLSEDHIPPNVNSFEVFGFDVMIDAALHCWLIEVNASPMLGLDTPLDRQIKTQLIRDTVQLVKPLPFNRARLVAYCERKLSPLGQFNARAATNASERRTGIEYCLTQVLGGARPRLYGEMPEQLGEYERLAPRTPIFDHCLAMKRSAVKVRSDAASQHRQKQPIIV